MFPLIASIIGMVAGLSALILSWVNYAKDNSNINIELKRRELKPTDGSTTPVCAWVIRVNNHGRRPAYITQIGLELSTRQDGVKRCLLVADSSKGRKITEADPPMIYIIPEHTLGPLSSIVTDDSRAIAFDSKGRKYLSNSIKESDYEVLSADPKYAAYVKGYLWLKVDGVYGSSDTDAANAIQQLVGPGRREGVL
jgi:hypothetical protein